MTPDCVDVSGVEKYLILQLEAIELFVRNVKLRTRVKGNRIRRKAIEELESRGYEVDIAEKTGRFIKIKDLFGITDLVALNKEEIRFIQVTCNKPHTHLKYQEFAKKYPLIRVSQLVWIDRKGWITYSYDGELISKLETFI